MRKLLITGGGGFIGANFAHRFVKQKYSVHLIEKRGTDLWRLQEIKDKVKIHYLDLRNSERIKHFISHLKPQVILHFAAYGAYQSREQEIRKTIDTNLLGTINLIQAASRIRFTCLLNAGTSSEYGEKQKPMKETDLLEANNLYGITKAASTLYCQYIARKENLPIITVRPFAVYGYYEDKKRLIPAVIKSCLLNQPLKLSSPHSVRDFIFIEDIITGYSKIIKKASALKGEIFNLGTGRQNTIAEVVRLVKKITHSTSKAEYGQVKAAQYEPPKWLANITKSKKILNFKPKYNLEQGLRKSVGWFRKNLFLYPEN